MRDTMSFDWSGGGTAGVEYGGWFDIAGVVVSAVVLSY